MVTKKRDQPPLPHLPVVREPRRASWVTRKAGSTPLVYDITSLPAHVLKTTPMVYKTRGRRSRVVQVSPGPQMPTLGQHTPPAEMLPVLAPDTFVTPDPVRRPGESTTAALNRLRRWAWRNRWQLTPLVAIIVTVVGAVLAPVATTLILAGIACAGFMTAVKGPDEIRGRKWFSRAERTTVGRWATGASAWVAGAGVTAAANARWTPAHVALAALALIILTAAPVIAWLKSRRVRRDKPAKLSSVAQQLAAAWIPATSYSDIAGLKGSRIVSMSEPTLGTIVAIVQLRADVHAETVANRDTARWLERALGMGVDTAKIELVRDHAGQVRIILTPTRHLEKTSKIWPGPVLHSDGRIPIAVTTDDRQACIRAYNRDGVRHLMIIGSTGSGKTTTYNVVLLPTVLARKSVLIYIDGKRGTSSPELAPAMDMVALQPGEWRGTIVMVHAVMLDREDRYGLLGLSTFDVNGDDPIIDLVIDEGTTVKRELADQHEAMLEAISERGRALGVSLKIGVQRPDADSVPGGMRVKDNLMGAAGNVVGLRPGGSVAKNMTLSATSAEINLLGLPEGGGWCAILREGAVEAEKARVLFIPDGSHIAKHFEGFIPRSLTGADAWAAGDTYANRLTGRAWVAAMQAARRGDTPPPASVRKPAEQPAERPASQPAKPVVGSSKAGEATEFTNAAARFQSAQGKVNQLAVRDALRSAGADGASRSELEVETGLSRATILRIVAKLIEDGEAERSDDNRVRLTAVEAVA